MEAINNQGTDILKVGQFSSLPFKTQRGTSYYSSLRVRELELPTFRKSNKKKTSKLCVSPSTAPPNSSH